MKSLLFICTIFSSIIVQEIGGLKVLGIFPFGTRSHFQVGHEIVKSLIDAGHEATVVSPYPLKTPVDRYEDVSIAEILSVFEKDVDPFKLRKLPKFIAIPFLHSIGNQVVSAVMEHPGVQKLMRSNEKFDVCFLELFHAHALTGIFDHFGCVYIPYTSSAFKQWVDFVTGNPSPNSYVQSPMLPYSQRMDFTQRFWNVAYDLFETSLYHTYAMPSQRRLYEKYFPNAKRSLDEMLRSASIALLSTHVSITGARPYLPGLIEIAGIHIPPVKPLPQKLQKFVDDASDGVILFTMGSFVQAHQFPDDIREMFVAAFGKLKQKVIWKYENETLPNRSGNVLIGDWVPQRDLLAHGNVKVFITHGGYLGTSEATSEGVPMLGLPFYGDQGMNLAQAAAAGRSITLDFDDLSEEKIVTALNELVTNPTYRQNAKAVAERFHDRPMTPRQSVVYWTEYAVRHKGAAFVACVGNELNSIEFHNVDVYGVLLLIGLVALYISYRVLRGIVKRIFTNTKAKKQKVK